MDPETARLIIAQRLGLSRFHSIEHADAETLGHINTFGGQQQRLFGGDVADRSRAHLLMWIENAEQDQATGRQDHVECCGDHILTACFSHRQRRLRPHAGFCRLKSPFNFG